MTLSAPDGCCAVGTVHLQLVDTTRPQHLTGDKAGRRVRVRMWYPAITQAPAPGMPALVWNDLRQDARTPRLVRMMLAMLRARATALEGAPLLAQADEPAPIVYHHGFVSFAAENESLMEMAASHGHLVISIEHMDQLVEYQALERRLPAPLRNTAAQLAARIARATPAERSALAREYYLASANTSRIVKERATDTAFVLERMSQLRAALPGASPRSSDARVHLMGFSVGGAVATAVAHRHAHALSVVNLDGGTQGIIDATALRLPYLMLYSARNEGINDELLPPHTERLTMPGTRHLNFHDIAGLLPVLRHTPALGGCDPVDLLQQRNAAVRVFLQKQRAYQLPLIRPDSLVCRL